jgi:hypothetical protein
MSRDVSFLILPVWCPESLLYPDIPPFLEIEKAFCCYVIE